MQKDSQPILCRIADAIFKENTEVLDEEEEYYNYIHLTLKNISDETNYFIFLAEKDIRLIRGVERPLSSKEMVDLALVLRYWEGNVKILREPKDQSLTVEDILFEDMLEDKEVKEPDLSKVAYVSRFKYPQKQKRED